MCIFVGPPSAICGQALRGAFCVLFCLAERFGGRGGWVALTKTVGSASNEGEPFNLKAVGLRLLRGAV